MSSTAGKQLSKVKDKEGRKKKADLSFKNVDRYYPTVNKRIFRQYGDYYKGVYVNGEKKGDFYVDKINSKYLGKHPFRIGTRQQKYRKACDPMFELYHLYKDVFDEVGVNVDDSIVLVGSYESNKHILQRTMIPEGDNIGVSGLNEEGLSSYDNVIKSVLRKVIKFQLPDPNFSDLINCYYNKDTLPGFHYQNMFGFKNKEESAETAFTIAKTKWNYIEVNCRKGTPLSREFLFPSTYTIGARNKRDFYISDDDLMTSRAIHMPEFHDELSSSPWLNPITDRIIERGDGPIYIGNSYVRYERLVKDCESSKTILEGDWKRFDSTLYINVILMGVAVMRCFYPAESRRADYHFKSIFDSLSIKDYYTPGGNLYRLYNGIPSGVKCTNLLGSIINLIVLIKCCNESNTKRMNFCVGGDDHLVIFKDEIVDEDYLNRIISRAENFGMKFKFLKIKNFKNVKSDDRPVFYKYTIDRGEPIIPASSMLERVFLPWNKNYSDNFLCFKFLREVLPSLGAPRTTHLLYYALYKSVYDRIFDSNISISKIFKIHKTTYLKIMKEKADNKLIFEKKRSKKIKGIITKEGRILRECYLRGVK